MKRALAFILVSLASSSGALAEKVSNNELMTAKAMKAELYGVRLSGIELGTGARWSECIDPAGRTVYTYEGTRIEGLLAITDTPAACFTYPGSGTSCYRVQRALKGYLFRSAEYGNAYYASKVERGIKSCAASNLTS